MWNFVGDVLLDGGWLWMRFSDDVSIERRFCYKHLFGSLQYLFVSTAYVVAVVGDNRDIFSHITE